MEPSLKWEKSSPRTSPKALCRRYVLPLRSLKPFSRCEGIIECTLCQYSIVMNKRICVRAHLAQTRHAQKACAEMREPMTASDTISTQTGLSCAALLETRLVELSPDTLSFPEAAVFLPSDGRWAAAKETSLPVLFAGGGRPCLLRRFLY